MSTIKKDERSRQAIREAFLKRLEVTGNVTLAAKNAKIDRGSIYRWLKTDAEFKKQYDESVAIAIDMLEDEAQRPGRARCGKACIPRR